MTQRLALRSGNAGPAFVGNLQNDTLLWDATAHAWFVGPGSGGGAVTSVFGRIGAIVANTNDYDSDQIANLSSVPGASVSDALDALATGGAVLVSNLTNGLAPLITGAGLALLSNGGGTAAAWGLVTQTSILGGVPIVPTLVARNAYPAPNRVVGMSVYEVDTDQIWRLIGGIANGNWVDVTVYTVSNVHPGIVPVVGVQDTILQSTGTAASWNVPLTYSAATATPTITQADLTTNGATGQLMTVRAQNATGTGGTVGGSLTVASGSGATDGSLTWQQGARVVGQWVGTGATDFIAIGGTPGVAGTPTAASGFLRVPNTFTIKYRNSNNLSDLTLLDMTTNGVQSITLGDANTVNGVILNCGAGGVRFQVNTATQVSIGTNVMNVFLANQLFAGTVNSPLINQTNNAAPTPFSIRAAGATAGSNGNGGRVLVQGGVRDGSGLRRGATLQLNVDDTVGNMVNLLEVSEVIQGNRVLSLLKPGFLTTAEMPANTGDMVIYFANCVTAPTTGVPVGGGILSAQGGALHWKGSAGTDTPIAPA